MRCLNFELIMRGIYIYQGSKHPPNLLTKLVYSLAVYIDEKLALT